MNLEHLNNLESYPSFNKQANLLTDGAKAIGGGVLRLFGKGPKATPPPAGAAATGAASQAAAATDDAQRLLKLERELEAARKAEEAALRARDGARQQASNYKSEATANRNWARVGKGAVGLGAVGTAAAGGAYVTNGTTPPDHSQGGQNHGSSSSKGVNNGGDSKGQGDAEQDWIDEAAAKISEFYEKHPGVAWGGTGLAALGGLYGLYNVLEDEDEDEDY